MYPTTLIPVHKGFSQSLCDCNIFLTRDQSQHKNLARLRPQRPQLWHISCILIAECRIFLHLIFLVKQRCSSAYMVCFFPLFSQTRHMFLSLVPESAGNQDAGTCSCILVHSCFRDWVRNLVPEMQKNRMWGTSTRYKKYVPGSVGKVSKRKLMAQKNVNKPTN